MVLFGSSGGGIKINGPKKQVDPIYYEIYHEITKKG